MAGEQHGFGLDPDDLMGYSKAATTLADELRSVATGTLGGASALPADSFGKVGVEVGLDAAFHKAAQAQVDGVTATASGVDELARSVGDAAGGYQSQDQDASIHMRLAGGQA